MSSLPRLPTHPNELDWMDAHLRCLYHHDEVGRIVRTRQPRGGPAPLFHLARTRLGNLWRLRADLDPACGRDLVRLAGREPPLPCEEPPDAPERIEAFRRRLGFEDGSLREWRGPAFRFPPGLQVPSGAHPLVEVTPDRADLLAYAFADWVDELRERQPCIAALENGRAVSLCAPSRPLEVPGSPPCPIAEAGVATRPERRGLGLGSRVVAAWALAVRACGGEPAYSTDWGNTASRAVARKLGLIPYGEDLHYSLFHG